MTIAPSASRVRLRVAARRGGRAGASRPAAASTIERRLGEVTGAAVDERRSTPATTRRSSTRSSGSATWRRGRRRRWASCSSGWCTPATGAAKRCVVFFGIRLGVALLVFVVLPTPLFVQPNLLLALAACGLGYVLPGMALGRLAKQRQHRIRLGLPDALDLLVVSVEAGLGLDQAIQRVGEELAFAHPDLCDELQPDQPRAARRQGARRGAAATSPSAPAWTTSSSLVAMLVQTDKFGTSVAQSLRVHSETVRTKRRQRAERSGGEDRRQDGVPAGVLHLPGDLGRDHRPGGDQVRPGPRPDGGTVKRHGNRDRWPRRDRSTMHAPRRRRRR